MKIYIYITLGEVQTYTNILVLLFTNFFYIRTQIRDITYQQYNSSMEVIYATLRK